MRKPAVLELSYQLPPDRTASTAVSTGLRAPVPMGEPGSVPTRWQITAPPGWVVIGSGGRARDGSRLGPARLAAGAAVEPDRGRPGTLARRRRAARIGGRGGRFTDADAGSLARRGGRAATLHAPQQVWLVGCSLVLVLLGLLLARLPCRPSPDGGSLVRRWAWLLLAVVLAALVLGVLLWPTLAGQVAYGCQPGAVVLLVIALVQWLLHEAYRRQIVFLPSFSRSRSGSSLLRREPERPHGEPSTIDAPAPEAALIGGDDKQPLPQPPPRSGEGEPRGGPSLTPPLRFGEGAGGGVPVSRSLLLLLLLLVSS